MRELVGPTDAFRRGGVCDCFLGARGRKERAERERERVVTEQATLATTIRFVT